MKISLRIAVLALIGILCASGCSAFPGLRVLAGQASGENNPDTIVQSSGLVMGDKSGLTDPALSADADRIETANQGKIDIVELNKDLNTDVFSVYMLIMPPDQNTSQADFSSEVERAIELTWEGTMNQSQGSNVLKVEMLFPGPVPTLDRGTSFIGYVFLDAEIARADAVTYLSHRPNTINDFFDLAAQGKMTLDQPQLGTVIYQGTPNHPVFMLSQLQSQMQSSGNSSNQGSN